MRLKTIASFGLPKTGGSAEALVSLNIAQGSVVDFKAPDSNERVGAIVNAANKGCLGGGGVDGAINNAGGYKLWRDREALPLLSEHGVRCHTGSAVVTGPNRYGNLRVDYVVHAVGPAYPFISKDRDDDDSDESNTDNDPVNEFAEPDALLRSAYQESLERCRENGITDVGFSLLSAGIFRGGRSLHEVLLIGILAIRDWVAEEEATNCKSSNEDGCDDVRSSPSPLQSITLCGFSQSEVQALIEVCQFVFEKKE